MPQPQVDTTALAAERAANGCPCDFCTRKKRWEDNWCARCGEVKLVPPKWWENMDVCDACDEAIRSAPEDSY